MSEMIVGRMEAELRSQLQHIHIIAQVRSCQPTNPNLNLFVMQLNRTVDLMEGRLAVQVLHNTSLLEKNHTCVRRIEDMVEQMQIHRDGAQMELSLEEDSNSMPQNQLSALGEPLFRCLRHSSLLIDPLRSCSG